MTDTLNELLERRAPIERNLAVIGRLDSGNDRQSDSDHGKDGKDEPDTDKSQDGEDNKDKSKRNGGDNDKDKDKDKNNDDDNEDGGGKKSKLPLIILAIVVVLAIIGGCIWWFTHRNLESTDDAYTEGNAVSIAPRVPGYVIEDQINDNMIVHAGDLLLKIDPRDYIAARDQAQANLDAALAQEMSAENDLRIARVRAPANYDKAEADLLEAMAKRDQAVNDLARQRAVDPRATTQTRVDQTTTALRTAQADVKSARAQVAVASLVQENIATAEAELRQKEAQVEQARAALSQANLNLSYTDIRAPIDGRITKRNVDLGTYLQAGQQVFNLVSNDLWVTANFKETQLKRMRLGQRVDIKVDAFPKLKLGGYIQSIQSGSGARFTAFPAENATGNFVKIVRRVPVKILIDRGLGQGQTLPLGLSVEPTVHLQ